MGDDIETRVKKVLGELNAVDPASLTGDERLIDDLHVDSLGLVELVLVLETEFGIELDEAEFDSIKTVADVVKYMEGRING
jgi:acyl carrier protein